MKNVTIYDAANPFEVFDEFCTLFPDQAKNTTSFTVKRWEDKSHAILIGMNDGTKILFDINGYVPGMIPWSGFRALLIPKDMTAGEAYHEEAEDEESDDD